MKSIDLFDYMVQFDKWTSPIHRVGLPLLPPPFRYGFSELNSIIYWNGNLLAISLPLTNQINISQYEKVPFSISSFLSVIFLNFIYPICCLNGSCVWFWEIFNSTPKEIIVCKYMPVPFNSFRYRNVFMTDEYIRNVEWKDECSNSSSAEQHTSQRRTDQMKNIFHPLEMHSVCVCGGGSTLYYLQYLLL